MCGRPRRNPVSFPASAVPASLADFLADGPAPSWLVRVGTLLALHFPADSQRLCLDRPGLLLQELGRPLFAILPGPAAEETHDVAKEIHSVIIGRPACGLLDPRLRCRGSVGGRLVGFNRCAQGARRAFLMVSCI